MVIHAAVTDAQVVNLIPACQRGEAMAIEQLYDLYADRVYRYLHARVGDGEAAADLTTEVFLRVIEHVGRFRLNRDRPAASFSAWLYRIAANLVTDHRRAQRRHPTVDLDDELELPAHEPDPQRAVERREEARRLADALEALTEDQRLVVIGKFAEEMSNLQIAALLGKTEGAVESLQHRALRALGRMLGRRELR
jgi:RNA polymerase sigma-70 factor, ECF subfamily